MSRDGRSPPWPFPDRVIAAPRGSARTPALGDVVPGRGASCASGYLLRDGGLADRHLERLGVRPVVTFLDEGKRQLTQRVHDVRPGLSLRTPLAHGGRNLTNASDDPAVVATLVGDRQVQGLASNRRHT